MSIGIAEADRREGSAPARVPAEKAMMKAKKDGKDQYVWFSPEMGKQKPRIDVRKDCPECQTHFSFSVDEEIYRSKESFFCPVCGEALKR